MTLVTAPLTWRQWWDLRWLDLRFLLLDVEKTPWWQLFVGLGLLVLAAGTTLWLVGCARVAWNGRPWAAIPLALGGMTLSLCAVLVPIGWSIYCAYQSRLRFGPGPWIDLTWLPDDAVGWIPLGFSLGVMGFGLAMIRRTRP